MIAHAFQPSPACFDVIFESCVDDSDSDCGSEQCLLKRKKRAMEQKVSAKGRNGLQIIGKNTQMNGRSSQLARRVPISCTAVFVSDFKIGSGGRTDINNHVKSTKHEKNANEKTSCRSMDNYVKKTDSTPSGKALE